MGWRWHLVSLKITKVRSDDPNLTRVQDNISVVLDFIQQSPLTGPSSRVSGISLTTSETPVAHGLGRRPLGFIVINQNAGYVIYQGTASNNPTLSMNLVATGTVVADILFF